MSLRMQDISDICKEMMMALYRDDRSAVHRNIDRITEGGAEALFKLHVCLAMASAPSGEDFDRDAGDFVGITVIAVNTETGEEKHVSLDDHEATRAVAYPFRMMTAVANQDWETAKALFMAVEDEDEIAANTTRLLAMAFQACFSDAAEMQSAAQQWDQDE